MRKKSWVLLPLAALLLTSSWGLAWQEPSQPKVDLNKADRQELQSLPGIGPAMADRIIEFREKNGPFKKVEDLLNVRGIGEKSFLKLKDRIVVKPAGTKAKPGRKRG